jgi:hypothetical protein
MQVHRRKRQKLCKRAVAAANAEDRPARAVLAHAARAPLTPPAPDVDFAGDALADPVRIGRRVDRFDNAGELVTWDALEFRVTVQELQIRSTDPGGPHTDEAFSPRRSRHRHVLQRDGP